jgi:glycosyltransferase involved in cell wall biosynthesis
MDPLVSIIVPTFNSAQHLFACLESISNQTYRSIELIIVDNNSTDTTKSIAKKFTKYVFNQGPERSAQVNFGVKRAKGMYVYKVDSDFVLEKNVVRECIDEAAKGFDAIVVHNSPDVRVSWIARIRKFEVDMYKYDLTYSSARFVRREVYLKIGGFNPEITAGEDYDFQNRLNRNGYRTGFIAAEALHLGEPRKFWQHMKKYFDYGRDFVNFRRSNRVEAKTQLSFSRPVYFNNWRSFTKRPLMAFAFIIYTACKFLAGGLGYGFGRMTEFKGE